MENKEILQLDNNYYFREEFPKYNNTYLLFMDGTLAKKNDENLDSFMYSLSKKEPYEMKQLFKVDGYDVNMSDIEGRNPLHYLAMNPGQFFKNNIDVLISAGIDKNKKDNYGWTPVYTAEKYGNGEFADYLLSKGGIVGFSRNNKKRSFKDIIRFNKSKSVTLAADDFVRFENDFQRAPLANYYVPAANEVVKEIKHAGLKTVMFCHSCNDSWAIEHALWMEDEAKKRGIKPIHGFLFERYFILPKTSSGYVKIWNGKKISNSEFYVIDCIKGERISQSNKVSIINDCNVNMRQICKELKLTPELESICR